MENNIGARKIFFELGQTLKQTFVLIEICNINLLYIIFLHYNGIGIYHILDLYNYMARVLPGIVIYILHTDKTI